MMKKKRRNKQTKINSDAIDNMILLLLVFLKFHVSREPKWLRMTRKGEPGWDPLPPQGGSIWGFFENSTCFKLIKVPKVLLKSLVKEFLA